MFLRYDNSKLRTWVQIFILMSGSLAARCAGEYCSNETSHSKNLHVNTFFIIHDKELLSGFCPLLLG